MLGERERALALYTHLQPYAARMVLALPICLGPLTRQLGSLAALLGLWTEAESHFAQAAAAAQAFRAPVLTALVDADRALAFRTHPDRRERRRNEQLLASAERAAGALGRAGLAARLSRA
jgi:hypothetical protein